MNRKKTTIDAEVKNALKINKMIDDKHNELIVKNPEILFRGQRLRYKDLNRNNQFWVCRKEIGVYNGWN